MLDRRYLYNTTSHADKLHSLYRGTWSEHINKTLETAFKSEYQEILSCFPTRTPQQEDDIRRAIPKWVRVYDPNMLKCSFNADDTHGIGLKYSDIQKDKFIKKLMNIIYKMTFAGIMQKTIEYAKTNKNRGNPSHEYSSHIQKFATPTSEWYHDKFAKDLWTNCSPSWKTKYLETKQEKLQMLEYWFKANKKLNRMPTVKDSWPVPKGSPLEQYAKMNFRILPTPGSVWREFNDADKSLLLLLPQIKKGKKPNGWRSFKYHYPEKAKELEKQYPEILMSRNEWLTKNLTNKQQKNVDKWNSVLQLVKSKPELSTLEWWTSLTKKQRYLVSNHAKFLDADFSLHGKKNKISRFISPIQAEIKKLRPDLEKWYVKKRKLNTLPMISVAKNKKQQDVLLQLAKNDKPRPTGSMSYVLVGFTRKNNNYPEFNKKIRTLRPDWFDRNILKKKIWERFRKKKSNHV